MLSPILCRAQFYVELSSIYNACKISDGIMAMETQVCFIISTAIPIPGIPIYFSFYLELSSISNACKSLF